MDEVTQYSELNCGCDWKVHDIRHDVLLTNRLQEE